MSAGGSMAKMSSRRLSSQMFKMDVGDAGKMVFLFFGGLICASDVSLKRVVLVCSLRVKVSFVI